jgi:hypothetical protein
MQRNKWRLVVVALASMTGCGSSPGESATEASAGLVGAGVDLIAVGSLGGTIGDRSVETASALENGVAGNLLGGLGSGLAYAGWNRFIALPDRGPNAVSYDSAIDDTSSYINRVQTIQMRLVPAAPGAQLPFALTPTLERTTLLWSLRSLNYGSGDGLGVGSGEPALNGSFRHFFTGRSDNFAPNQVSTDPRNGRLDPEGVRVSNDGLRIYISDEYGPYVYEFDRVTGARLRTFALPADFAVANLSPKGDTEIANNTSGRVANKGMEGLAISPDGTRLFGAMQSPLLQDGGTSGRFTRIVSIEIASGSIRQYAYELTNIGTAAKPKYPTISEIVAINDHEFLVDERDGKGLGDNSTAAFKRVFQIDLTGAAEVSGVSGETNLAGKAVAKTLFLDVVANLNAHGIASNDIPAKLEGLTFGPDIVLDGVPKRTLWLSNDNDYIGTVVDSNHPSGIDNPNRFFVFAIDYSALPTYVPQQLLAAF